MSTFADDDKMRSKLLFTATSSDKIQIAPTNFVLLVEYIVHGTTGTHVDAVAKAVIHD